MTAVNERPLGRTGRVALVLGLVPCVYLASSDLISMLIFLSYAAVGVALAIRRPRNSVSWLMLVIAFGFVATTVRPGGVDAEALVAGTASTLDFLNAWVGSWGGLATIGGLVALTLVFPTGQLPAGRWRKPALVPVLGCILAALITALAPTIAFNPDGGATDLIIPNRFSVLPDLPIWILVPADGGIVVLTVAFVGIGLASMIVRYRQASGIVRLQLRWFVSAVAFIALALAAAFIILFFFGDAVGGLAWIPAVVAYPTVPIAIGIAVMRYRLFEIDRIISRTLSWAVVSGILVGAFAGVVVAMQAVLAGFTQGETLAVAASTLVAFALFQPVRRRVQSVIDRRFNRSRYDAERTAAAFAERLRGQVDLAGVEADLARTVDSALRPTSTGVWLRVGR